MTRSRLLFTPVLPGLVLAFCLVRCAPAPEHSAPVATGFTLPYRLDRPDTSFSLPPALREISGLCTEPDSGRLLAVNDEHGIVFYLNPHNGAIEKRQEFGNPGDYEGITAANDAIWVVKSNGTLFQIPQQGPTRSYPTALDRGNDVEGLCFDPAQQQLLLACKGTAGQGKAFKHKKAVYAFDLQEKKLLEQPAFLLDRREIAGRKGGGGTFSARVLEYFGSDHAPSAFGPSGIAISPIDGNRYLVGAVGKSLAVVHPDGRLLGIYPLNAEQLVQPEGLCFDREGRLYLSTEGKNGRPGRIFRFELQQ